MDHGSVGGYSRVSALPAGDAIEIAGSAITNLEAVPPEAVSLTTLPPGAGEKA